MFLGSRSHAPDRRLALLLAVVAALLTGASTRAQTLPCRITDAGNHLHIELNDTPFTDYWYGSRDDRPYVRPFFLPVLASDGTPLTSDQYNVPKGDHPHHQSLWVAHENVSGVNHWLITGKPPAKQRHVRFEKIGPDSFVEDLQWEGNSEVLLNEVRSLRFISYPDGARAIDLTVSLTPAGETVILHDAKDAGLCAVRLAKPISDTATIVNSIGQVGEKQCWGQPADWCDESGTIDARPYGIAILDAPANPRHPSRWHVRQYGLLAANPFGLHEFDPKQFQSGAGDLAVEKGKTVTFHYRVVAHLGDAAAARIAEKYQSFAQEPPR